MEAKDKVINVKPIKLEDLIEESIKQGRREVVEWIEQQRVAQATLIEGVGYGIPISEERWQAKLKEWGIEK